MGCRSRRSLTQNTTSRTTYLALDLILNSTTIRLGNAGTWVRPVEKWRPVTVTYILSHGVGGSTNLMVDMAEKLIDATDCWNVPKSFLRIWRNPTGH